ncbi:MAG: hypothetical protein AAFN94_05560 [Pseudomonadota bacterium]
MFEIGTAYTIRKTAMNEKNRLPAGRVARIIFVDSRAISLRIDDHNTPDIMVPRPFFGMNFEEKKGAVVMPGPKEAGHANREYR